MDAREERAGPRTRSAEELERLTEQLSETSQQVGSRMYQKAAGTPPPTDGAPGQGEQSGQGGQGGEDVVEGEYHEM